MWSPLRGDRNDANDSAEVVGSESVLVPKQKSRSRLAGCQPIAARWYYVRLWRLHRALSLTGPSPPWESVAVLNRIPSVNAPLSGFQYR